MYIQENLRNLLREIPSGVQLVIVTKTQPPDSIQAIYNEGHRVFGENKVQELVAKHPQLPEDIEWHFIGHLQRNKVKYLVPFVSLIHSIDSFKLLIELNKEAGKISRRIRCLLQFHIATEETKFGLDRDEAVHMLNSDEFRNLEFVTVCGVMGMATFTDDIDLVRLEFRYLSDMFHRLKEEFFMESEDFKEISMGMTSDYRIAIEEGATLLRIGTLIFGPRYPGKDDLR